MDMVHTYAENKENKMITSISIDAKRSWVEIRTKILRTDAQLL